MALICTTSTTWITQTVLDPVDSWVSQQQTQCNNYPWPLNWLCSVVTVLVKITTWVTRYILVPVLHITCVVITAILGGILYPFAWAIDSVCKTCNTHQWVELWWLTPTKITFVKKEISKTNPDYFDYTFTCNCKNGKKEIIVTAANDIDAEKLAIDGCKGVC